MYTIYNYSLLHRNTFGLNVWADRFVEYGTEDELRRLVLSGDMLLPVLHIGQGSNLLFTGDFKGTVLHSAIRGITLLREDDECAWVRIGAGERWDDVVVSAIEHGWYGIENLSLIPGETGAAAVQNIGAYGAEISDFVDAVEAIDLTTAEMRTFTSEEIGYGYRSSRFKSDWKGRYAVTHVTLCLRKTFKPNLSHRSLRESAEKWNAEQITPQSMRQIVIAVRRSKLPDPATTGNAGSFFVNPVVTPEVAQRLLAEYPDMPHYEVGGGVKIPAGWLIEQAGWKGRRQGSAGVYDKQALVLVNYGGASPAEVLALCHAVQNDVKKRFDITITPEVNII